MTYELSVEDRFQEQAERWVDVPSRRQLPADLGQADTGGSGRAGRAAANGGLMAAIAEAHRLIDAGARPGAGARRRGQRRLPCGTRPRRRVLRRRDRRDRDPAGDRSAERKAVLDQRLRATREEEARRLSEIAEKYEASHTIRPYRLHVIVVPALRLAADVRRAMRVPDDFDWLLPPGRSRRSGARPAGARRRSWRAAEARLRDVPASGVAAPAVEAPAVAAPAAAGRAGPARPVSGAPRGARPPPAARPVPPQAKRRAVVPPKVRKEQQKATATLAERLWRAVAADDRRTIRRILHPGSPAAALDRVLGPAGLCRVVGMPPGEEPEKFLAETDGDAITGALLGAAGTECPYCIYCRDGQAAEVLPFPVGDDGTFWPFYWWGQRSGGRWASSPISRPRAWIQSKARSPSPVWRGTACRSRAAPWPRGEGSPTITSGCFPRIRRARWPRP